MKKFVATLAALTLLGAAPAMAQSGNMSFFITSAGSGDGANLGGLRGADQICQDLAYAQGFGDLTWHAYLSAAPEGTRGTPIHARDRIGTGPWYNADGVMIAESVADLHSENNNLTKETQLNEMGSVVNGRGDSPNMHDLMTGSNLDGTLYTGEGTTVCGNWTSNGEGSTRVGHHDRQGGGDNPNSWNSAHDSRGCSQENLQASGGNGFFYCFAIDGNEEQFAIPERRRD